MERRFGVVLYLQLYFKCDSVAIENAGKLDAKILHRISGDAEGSTLSAKSMPDATPAAATAREVGTITKGKRVMKKMHYGVRAERGSVRGRSYL